MAAPAPGGDSGNVLEFMRLLDNLKHKKRRGWTFYPEITEVETIACHMHRMACCAFLLPSSYNTTKIMKMALVHDLCESIVEDYTPSDPITPEEKHRLERDAVEQICTLTGQQWSADELMALFLEFEAKETEEAKICSELDKFDMLV
jgi:putative hydrolase of HD superfamily